MASTYLTRTPGSAGNQQIWTLSAWIKKSTTGTANQNLFSQTGGGSTSQRMYVLFSDDLLVVSQYNGSSSDFNYTTNALFRDPAAWYHLVVSVDTTQATDSNRVKIYMNGEQITSFSSTAHPSQNLNTYVNTTQVIGIGHDTKVASRFFDGYMSETHLIDGTAYAASTFGQTDTTGVWGPIVAPSVTYGTNGFYLKFANSAAMGTDSSGNSNTFAVGNGNVMQVGDTPTNNFPTFNPLGTDYGLGLGSANLRAFTSNSQTYPHIMSNFAVKSGKWYLETLRSANSVTGGMGVFNTLTDADGNPTEKYMYYTTGNKDTNGSQSAYGASWGQGDLISTTYDATNGQVSFYKNGVSQGVAFTLDTSKYWQFGIQSYTSGTQEDIINFGQEGTFIGNKTAGGNADANGYGNFFYTVPSGFLALCTQNMSSEITIPVNKGVDNFNTVLYTGTGSSQNITGVGFQPDWTWIKCRSVARDNVLTDNVRGATKALVSNTTGAETTDASGLTSFDSDGFTVGGANAYGGNGETHVGWNWKAGGTAPANTYVVKVVSDTGNKYRFDDYGTSAITLELQEGGTFTFDQSDASNAGHPLRFSSTADGTHGGGSEYTTGVTTTGTPGQAGAKTVITVAGSAPTLYYYCSVHSGMGGQANTGSLFGFTNVKGINQSVVSPNTTAGFSIVKYTRDGNSSTTVGHGLGKTPKVKIEKDRDTGSTNWSFITSASGSDQYGFLNLTDAFGSTTSGFTSTVFNSAMGANQGDIIAYVFAEIEGYSKFGSYTGSGNADGPFVYTGFRPAWVMIKKSNSTGRWTLQDAVREPFNVVQKFLLAESSDAEDTSAGQDLDFLSNGFKIRNSNARQNGDGDTYIYLAFAENPFVTSTGKPVTAR
jgi:hypothetical protein